MSDLRFALRSLVKNPGFSAVVILTLALGIGANTAVFSIFDHALLRMLPVPDPEELVNLSSPGPKTGSTSANSGFGGRNEVFSYPLFRDIEQIRTVFTGVAAHRDFQANLTFKGQAWNDEGLLVSDSYFPVLKLQPALGRLLAPSDGGSPGTDHVVVLGYDYWRNRFGADPSVVGQSVIVNGQPLVIIGVTPAPFVGTVLDDKPTFFVPLQMASLMKPDWDGFTDRRDHWLYLFARLTPGTSHEDAERTINIPFARLINEVELPAQRDGFSEDAALEAFAQRRLRIDTGGQGQRPAQDDVRRLALLLLCVTGSVLLMACANVANLLLARGVNRGSELAIRLSLGAGRGALMRSLMIESALLVALGGAVGVLLAMWTLGAVTPMLPGAATFRFTFDAVVFTSTLGVSAVAVLLIGSYPALYSTRPDVTLREGVRSSRSSGVTRFRRMLTATQVAASLTLLVLAGLFTKSLLNVGSVDLGVQPERLLTFRLNPELNGYSRDRARLLVERVQEELLMLSGIASVSTSTIPLLDGFGWSRNVTPDNGTSAQDARNADVGPGYFGTVGLPLVAGREFAVADRVGSPKVAIVNESFVKAFGLGPNALGRRIGLGAGNIPIDIEIVGVARDARYSDIKSAPGPQFYLPYYQVQEFSAVNFYVRSNGTPAPLLPQIVQLMARVDRTIPVENLRTMNDQVRAATDQDRSLTTVSAAFALLAVMLAAVGLYGVLSYDVAQRRREIGVRMALGATAWRVARLVFGHIAVVTLIGAIAGALAAVGLGRVAESMLFGVDGIDLVVMVGATSIVMAVAVCAAALPARRAVRVNPMTALRAE